MKSNEKILRQVLKVNAGFSGVNGLLLILFKSDLANLMGVTEADVLLYIGIALIFFSGIVLLTAFRKSLKKQEVWSIVLQDWMWVAGSLLILLFQPFGLSRSGHLLITMVAAVVAGFALLQGKYVRERA